MKNQITSRLAGFNLLFALSLIVGCTEEAQRPQQTAPKWITSFRFTMASNNTLTKDVVASISDGNRDIYVTVPYGAPLNALFPTMVVVSGATIQPASGIAQDFRSDVFYTVTGPDGTALTYRVVATVSRPLSKNATLSVSYNGKASIETNDGTSDRFYVVAPATEDLSKVRLSLTPQDTTSTLSEGGTAIALKDGAKEFDFSSQNTRTLTVRSADGSNTRNYVVQVTQATATSKEIVAFALTTPHAVGVIDDANNTIQVSVPRGTKLNAIATTVQHTGRSIAPVESETIDLSAAGATVTYTVTATDNTTRAYALSVVTTPREGNSLAARYAYNYKTKENNMTVVSKSQFAAPVVANNDLYIVLPDSADSRVVQLTLEPSTAAMLAEGNTLLTLTEGKITQDFDFTNAPTKTFVVTSESGAARTFTVHVASTTQTSKSIAAFYFAGGARANASFFNNSLVVQGVVDEANRKISVVIPAFSNPAKLTPTIWHTGASISPRSGVSTDFRKEIKYTVTAHDGSKQEYTVELSEANP